MIEEQLDLIQFPYAGKLIHVLRSTVVAKIVLKSDRVNGQGPDGSQWEDMDLQAAVHD